MSFLVLLMPKSLESSLAPHLLGTKLKETGFSYGNPGFFIATFFLGMNPWPNWLWSGKQDHVTQVLTPNWMGNPVGSIFRIYPAVHHFLAVLSHHHLFPGLLQQSSSWCFSFHLCPPKVSSSYNRVILQKCKRDSFAQMSFSMFSHPPQIKNQRSS